MRTRSFHRSILKHADHFAILPSFMLLALSVFTSQAVAQAPTQWSLNPNIPHAIAADRSYYPTTFTVRRLDSEGGYVQARAIKPGEPECFATFDFNWSFSTPLNVIRQGDIFDVRIEAIANPGSNCAPPLDPYIQLTPVAGTLSNTAIVEEFDFAEHKLVLWHPSPPSRLGRVDVPSTNSGLFSLEVDDTRTSTGNNLNAQRGGFKIILAYRGSTFEAYYVFLANGNASTDGFVQSGWTPLGPLDRWCTAELECSGAIPACDPNGTNAGRVIQDRRAHNGCVAQGCGDPSRPQQTNQTYVCE